MTKLYLALVVAAVFLSFSIGKELAEGPALVVEQSKLNALYRELPNPIQVSAKGVAPEDIELDVKNGEVSGSIGKYNIKVMAPGPVTVDIYENLGKGKKRFLGVREYVAKYMPKPYAVFLGRVSGSEKYWGVREAQTTYFLPEGKVLSGLHNAEVRTDFDYDLPIYIVRFDMQTVVDGDTIVHRANDNFLSLDMLQELNKSAHDQKFYFNAILAELPDKTTMWLSNITMTMARNHLHGMRTYTTDEVREGLLRKGIDPEKLDTLNRESKH